MTLCCVGDFGQVRRLRGVVLGSEEIEEGHFGQVGRIRGVNLSKWSDSGLTYSLSFFTLSFWDLVFINLLEPTVHMAMP